MNELNGNVKRRLEAIQRLVTVRNALDATGMGCFAIRARIRWNILCLRMLEAFNG